MKLLISIDMEGIWGLTSWNEPQEKIAYFMTKELNLVINTIKKIHKKAEIVVVDSHSLGTNIIPDQIPSDVALIRGFPREYYMMESIDSSYDGCLFIGYHAPSGVLPGIMDHTYSSSSFYEIAINGKTVGEAEINGLLAGFYGVPVILISGDNLLFEFSQKNFPNTPFVITKRSLSRFSAELLPYEKVIKDYESAIEKAFDTIKDIKPLEPTPPFTIEIATLDTLSAFLISQIPGTSLISGRKVSYSSPNFKDIYKFLMVASYCGWASKRLQS